MGALINYTNPPRKHLGLIFLLASILSVVLLILSVYFVITGVNLKSETAFNRDLIATYMGKIQASGPKQDMLDRSLAFKKALNQLATARPYSMNLVAFLSILEANHPDDLVYKYLDYDQKSGKSIVEFLVEDEQVATDMVSRFEGIDRFGQISVLKKKRGSGDNSKSTFQVEIKF